MKSLGTYSFLDTIRLKGSKPGNASCKSSKTFLSATSLLPFATSLFFEGWERVSGNRDNPLVGFFYQLRANVQRRKVGTRVDKIQNLREWHLGKRIKAVV